MSQDSQYLTFLNNIGSRKISRFPCPRGRISFWESQPLATRLQRRQWEIGRPGKCHPNGPTRRRERGGAEVLWHCRHWEKKTTIPRTSFLGCRCQERRFDRPRDWHAADRAQKQHAIHEPHVAGHPGQSQRRQPVRGCQDGQVEVCSRWVHRVGNYLVYGCL